MLILTQGVHRLSLCPATRGHVRIKPFTLTPLAMGLITAPSTLHLERPHPTHPTRLPAPCSTHTTWLPTQALTLPASRDSRALEPQVGYREGGTFLSRQVRTSQVGRETAQGGLSHGGLGHWDASWPALRSLPRGLCVGCSLSLISSTPQRSFHPRALRPPWAAPGDYVSGGHHHLNVPYCHLLHSLWGPPPHPHRRTRPTGRGLVLLVHCVPQN